MPTGGCLVQLAKEDSKALGEMKNIAEGRLQDYKSRLEGAKKQVEDQVREFHWVEGAQSSNTLAIKLQMEIDCMQDPIARQRLVNLIGQFLSTTRDNLAELEAKVARAKELLAKVETNIAQELEHFKFCVSMERTSHNVGASLMKPFPLVDFEQSISEVVIQGFYHCVGCGFPFDARSLDVFSLPCTHVYHMLCFAHVRRDHGYCVALDCNMHVPPRAKHMIGLKVKSEMKESSAEQSWHAFSNKMMHSTRKNILIIPGMQPALEAESAVGDEVCGVVEDILMAKSCVVKSLRQQLTPRRLLRSPLSAKASQSVDTRDEALDEAVADAVKATPPPAGKKPTPKRKKSTPKNLGNQEAKKRGICMRCTRSSGFLDEGSVGSLAQSYLVKNPRGRATASKGVTSKKKVCFDIVDHGTLTSIAEFVPNVPNAHDVLVVHDDVHTDVDRAKLEKGTLPTPTIVESGTDAIIDAMIVDACTDAIADAIVVDACTNDIVDAMEVDASIDAVADGNVNDGGTESIVRAVIDAILDALEAMGTNATIVSGTDAIVDDMVVDACTDAIADARIVDACTNDIVDAMEVDASIDDAVDGNVNDGGTESIVRAVIDALLDVVEAMGTDATFEDTRGMGEEVLIEREVGRHEAVGASDVTTQAEVACPSGATIEDTRGMGEEVLIEREARAREAVGASDITAQAKVVCPSDAIDDIVDAEEAKGTNAVVEDMRGLGEENLTKTVPRIGSAVGTDDVAASVDTAEAGDRAVQSGEAMGEAVIAATDMKEANTHNTTKACIEQNNEARKGTKVPTDRAAQLGAAMGEDTNEAGTKNANKEAKKGHESEGQER
ncbi:hypothetical protein L7F22_056862 [Adiantum nelumboides]|nr:hypothetical protein [Adiantum nelumboides]